MCQDKKNENFGEQIINDVLKMKARGKTNRKISEYYEFKDKYVFVTIFVWNR